MKPLNLDNKPCSPISSNCVVWQGPDIPCIELCTGDSVSDVVFAMATELCTILDTLKVSNYDLTCFNLDSCGPADFQALIQFLITHICELEGVTPVTKDIPTCPDCVVSVAECFVTGTQTTMQLVDYVQLIGERLCSLITEISLINTQITDILIRLTTLENEPAPTFTVPSFTIDCQIGSLLSGTDQAIDVLLEEFINNVWCGFFAITGSGVELTTAIGRKCVTDATLTLVDPTDTFAVEYLGTWVPDASYDTVADAINNIWIVLCDVFNYLSTTAFTITVADTPTIDLELSVGNELTAVIQDTGWIDLLGFSYHTVVGQVPQCRRMGNVLYFRGTLTVPIGDASDGSGGAVVALNGTSVYNAVQSGGSYNTLQATGTPDSACLLITEADAAWNVGDVAIKLQFNRGDSVIPAGILNINGATGETLDTYGGNITGNVLGTRWVRDGTGADYTHSSVIRLQLSSDGILGMNSANYEDLYRGVPATGSSQTPEVVAQMPRSSMHLQLCTHAVTGEKIPNFKQTPYTTNSIYGIDAGAAAPFYSELEVGDPVEATFSFDQDMSRADQIGGLQINLAQLQVIINQP